MLTIEIHRIVNNRLAPGALGTRQMETVERVELKPFERWGMFSARGNRRVRELAVRAQAKVEAAMVLPTVQRRDTVRKALRMFVLGWLRLGRTKTYGEAGDTEVRGAVGEFHDRLAEASGLWDRWDLGSHKLWEESLEWAYAQRSKTKAGI